MKKIVMTMKPMLGSQGILPALFTRVNRTAHPSAGRVLALLKAGGYMRHNTFETSEDHDAKLEEILEVVKGRDPGLLLVVDGSTGDMTMRPFAGSRTSAVGNVLDVLGIPHAPERPDGGAATYRIEATDIGGASEIKDRLGLDDATYAAMRRGAVELRITRPQAIELCVGMVERLASLHSKYSRSVEYDQEAEMPRKLRDLVTSVTLLETLEPSGA